MKALCAELLPPIVQSMSWTWFTKGICKTLSSLYALGWGMRLLRMPLRRAPPLLTTFKASTTLQYQANVNDFHFEASSADADQLRAATRSRYERLPPSSRRRQAANDEIFHDSTSWLGHRSRYIESWATLPPRRWRFRRFWLIYKFSPGDHLLEAKEEAFFTSAHRNFKAWAPSWDER